MFISSLLAVIVTDTDTRLNYFYVLLLNVAHKPQTSGPNLDLF